MDFNIPENREVELMLSQKRSRPSPWPAIGVFVFVLFSSFSPSFGQNITGQIINVSQSYKIAFTDLGNHSLRVGDVVKVFIDDNQFMYMQVMESSSVLSKLGFVQNESFTTNPQHFQRISVGNPVIKEDKALSAEIDKEIAAIATGKNLEPAKSPAIECKNIEEELINAKIENKNLLKKNADFIVQISGLSEELKKLKAKKSSCPVIEDPKSDLPEIKAKLEKMQQLIDQMK